MISKLPIRILGAVEMAVGAVLLARPDAGAQLLSADDRVPPVLARLLGGRLALQGAALFLMPSDWVGRLAVTADVLHAASMVPVAVAFPEYRQPAVLNLAGASCLAALTLAVRR